MTFIPTALQYVLLIFVILMVFNIIIFVHELGHFLAGKWRGLQIDKFQIWFGKPIWKKTIGGVQYGLGWIPAGGFVALPQMAPMEAIEGGDAEGREGLAPITPLDKMIVAFAGPLFSVLLALLSAVIVWGVGKPKDFIPTNTIGFVVAESAGEKAGILPGDEVVEINGKAINGFAGSLDSITENVVLSSGDEIVFTVRHPGVDEMLELTSGFKQADSRWWQRSGLRQVGLGPASPALVGKIYENSPADKAGLVAGDEILSVDGQKLYAGPQFNYYLLKNDYKTVDLVVKKASGEVVNVQLTPESPIQPKGIDPKIGVFWADSRDVDVRIVHPNPFAQVYDTVRMMWVTVTSVADPKSSIGIDHLSGPVGIFDMMLSLLQSEDGWRRILGFMVLFNVNLAILNMLPFPVLDGGHITLAILEKIAGKPVHAKALEIVQTVCALGLISLMLYVTSKDIGNKIRPGEKREQGEMIFSAE